MTRRDLFKLACLPFLGAVLPSKPKEKAYITEWTHYAEPIQIREPRYETQQWLEDLEFPGLMKVRRGELQRFLVRKRLELGGGEENAIDTGACREKTGGLRA